MDKTRKEYPDIAPAGPTFARAVQVGGTLYISGCTARGTDAQGGPAIEQFKVVWDRLVRIVEAEGGTATDIVKITTFVTDMREWFPASAEQQSVMYGYFGGQNPANSLVEITALAEPGLDVEIEAIVALD